MQKSGTFYLVEDEMTKFKNKCSRVFLFLCVMIFALSVCINLTFTIAPVSGLSMFPTLNKDYIASNEEETQDLVILNYANGDMVGHTGDLTASIKAVETLDNCLDKLYKKIK